MRWAAVLALAFVVRSAQAAEGGWIVVLDDDLAPGEVARAAEDLARSQRVALGPVYQYALNGFAFAGPARAASAMLADPRVRGVTFDGEVYASCHEGDPQVLPTGVDRINADLSPTAAVNGVDQRVDADIAVIDTGVYRHSDLNVYRAVDCTKRGCKTVNPSDPNGHGTHVAGSAGALDNGGGVVGVAPGARIWSVRVLGSGGTGKWSWVVAGLDYVAKNSAAVDVASMSLGGPGSVRAVCGTAASGQVVDALHKALCGVVAKGVVVAVAAGNESDDAENHVPAAYPEALTVSALADSDGQPGGLGPNTSAGPDDSFADFSNFGEGVDLIAPGVDIYSTWPGSGSVPQGYCATLSGTSMATPHVSGAAGLYTAANGRDMNHDGKTDAADVGALRDALLSSGRCPNGSAAGSGGCAGSWPGDPDGIAEPLVWPAGF